MAEILPPHAASLSPVRVLKAIAEGPPPTFSFAQPSPELREVVVACLQKDMARRPTAAECLSSFGETGLRLTADAEEAVRAILLVLFICVC